jgi:hypothetical protein
MCSCCRTTHKSYPCGVAPLFRSILSSQSDTDARALMRSCAQALSAHGLSGIRLLRYFCFLNRSQWTNFEHVARNHHLSASAVAAPLATKPQLNKFCTSNFLKGAKPRPFNNAAHHPDLRVAPFLDVSMMHVECS